MRNVGWRRVAGDGGVREGGGEEGDHIHLCVCMGIWGPKPSPHILPPLPPRLPHPAVLRGKGRIPVADYRLATEISMSHEQPSPAMASSSGSSAAPSVPSHSSRSGSGSGSRAASMSRSSHAPTGSSSVSSTGPPQASSSAPTGAAAAAGLTRLELEGGGGRRRMYARCAPRGLCRGPSRGQG